MDVCRNCHRDSPTTTFKSLHRWRIFLNVAVIGGVSFAYHVASTSINAEKNLHATLFAIRLVESFVGEHGRWPASCEELEGLTFPPTVPRPAHGLAPGIVRIGGAQQYAWPAEANEVRSRVEIDFQVDAATVANQDPQQFTAIKPIGPFYEYRHYGFVTSLQQSLREAGRTYQP